MATALITGASSGIGEAFAQALAQRGFDLVLVARSLEKLEALAESLQIKSGISAWVIQQDLIAKDAVEKIYSFVQEKELTIDLLINNAGFGDYGLFAHSDRQKQLDMIDLNVRSLVEMTHAWLPEMKARGIGDIINVSSIAGFQPMPYLSVYAATKAFVLNFSEAIWSENKDNGIKVLALCPGPTETNFMNVACFPSDLNGPPQKLVTSEEVVEAALQALARGQSNEVTGGLLNKFVVNSPRFLPRPWLVNSIKQIFAS